MPVPPARRRVLATLDHAERIGPHASVVRLDTAVTEVWLEGVAPAKRAGQTTLYGFSLEQADAAGVLYHAMAVNGAQHRHFAASAHFFHHLGLLRPDLVIVSLGTNEAMQNGFTSEGFARDLRRFADNLAQHAPAAAVLVATPPDLVTTPQARRQLALVAEAQVALVQTRGFAFWDFRSVMKPFADWQAAGLAQGDGVHLTPAGYRMHGRLLLNALLSRYAAHASRSE